MKTKNLVEAFATLFSFVIVFVLISVLTASFSKSSGKDTDNIKSEQDIIQSACTHTFGEWRITEKPTCSVEGTQSRKCSLCEYEETKKIATTTHNLIETMYQAPTCTATGTRQTKCNDCQQYFLEELPPIHRYSVLTCTEDSVCSVCGKEGEKATGHTEVTLEAIAPTCENDGLTEGKKCSVCDEILVAQEVISATGHNSGWTVLEEPTLNTNGVKVKKCELCGDVLEWGEVPALLTYTYNGTNSYMVSKGDTELTGVLEIPSHYMGVPVTEIGDFSGCTKITRVIIPDSVTRIDYMAFADCTSMTSVEIPNSVTFIGPSAFSNTLLYEVYIPSSVTTMGDNVFRDCSSLHNGESRTAIYCGASSKPDGWAENWAGGSAYIEWGASPP